MHPKELFKNILYKSEQMMGVSNGFKLRKLSIDERIERLMKRYIRETMKIITTNIQEQIEQENADFFESVLVYITDKDSNSAYKDSSVPFQQFKNIYKFIL